MSRWRLPCRLAARELRARPGRTLLVALLVAVPVGGMVSFAVVARTLPPYSDVTEVGQADLAVQDSQEAMPPFDAERAFPGSRTAHITRVWSRVRTVDGRRATAHIEAGDLDRPIAAGVVSVVRGRLPHTPGEVALSPQARRVLGVGAGDVLRLDRPALTLRVVGTAVEPFAYGSTLLVLHDLPDGVMSPGVVERRTLIDLPGTPSLDERFAARNAVPDAYGVTVGHWLVGSTDSRQDPIYGSYVVGALVLLVFGIIIAAAFAIGARRQLRTLGLLAANGAAPRTLRDVLLVEGALSGAVGVALGGLLAATGLAIASPHRDRLLDRVSDGWSFRLLDLVPIAVIGIGAATIAAAQPARSASRVGVRHALAGQRPAGRVPGWLVPTGLAAFAGGVGLLVLAVLGAQTRSDGPALVWTATAILGGVGIVLGAIALAPAILARLEPVAARLRGTWRLAARSLARSRARSSAVVAAVAAAAALSVAVAAVALSIDAHDRQSGRHTLPADVVAVFGGVAPVGTTPSPLDPAVVRRVATTVGATDWATFEQLSLGIIEARSATSFYGHNATVATPELQRFLGLDQRGRETLAAGRMVLVDRLGSTFAGTVALRVQAWVSGADGPSHDEEVEAVVVHDRFGAASALPDVLVPASLGDRLGAGPGNSSALVRTPAPLTAAQRDALADLRDDLADEALDRGELRPYAGLGLGWESPSRSPVAAIEAGLVAFALVFTLLVLAVGLGLSAAESRSERDALVAVGASPRSSRRLAGAKAAILALVGGALAVPMALVPVAAWARAMSPDMPFRFPVVVVAVLLAGVPAAACVLTWGCSAVAARARPVRASTFAAD